MNKISLFTIYQDINCRWDGSTLVDSFQNAIKWENPPRPLFTCAERVVSFRCAVVSKCEKQFLFSSHKMRYRSRTSYVFKPSLFQLKNVCLHLVVIHVKHHANSFTSIHLHLPLNWLDWLNSSTSFSNSNELRKIKLQQQRNSFLICFPFICEFTVTWELENWYFVFHVVFFWIFFSLVEWNSTKKIRKEVEN